MLCSVLGKSLGLCLDARVWLNTRAVPELRLWESVGVSMKFAKRKQGVQAEGLSRRKKIHTHTHTHTHTAGQKDKSANVMRKYCSRMRSGTSTVTTPRALSR